ncbi:MAG: hypothetical protein E7773_06895 [Sphingomonas sp.]|uniref:hypothetical protein n=1 Tax=Sphingomonas sp. TaxID=28214 RepID=UPI0011FA0089|nr:hypothetical protein [Sphingomonas sp.]THD36721.1 MAG: hypothetical protein E7773_06895 [Sphingomonas sp.]
MRPGKFLRAAGIGAALFTTTATFAQDFSNAQFEINRDRVKYGTIGSCAKSTAFLVPTVYLYVPVRTKLSAGGGINAVGVKARVYIDGAGKAELQQLAGSIQNEMVGALRGAGYTVLTFDDVRGDVAGKSLMAANPRYGMPTHDARAFPGTDFVVATPSDAQALEYGLIGGPNKPFADAAKRTGATQLITEVYLTMPQLGAQAANGENSMFRSSSASISFNPSMHLAGITVYGLTAKGSWCSIGVPEHGVRVPASRVGTFREISVSDDDSSEWGKRRGDYAFVVDDDAFRTGVLAVGRSLGRLTADAMTSKR